MAKRVNEDGEIWAVPVGETGFCPAVVARSADPSDPVGFSLVYVRPTLTATPADAGDVPPLADWETTWVGLVSRRPFSTHRWTLVDSVPSFKPSDWPMPPWQETPPPREEATEGWSVATTSERPSLTVLVNKPEPRAIAEQFPSWQIITAPSAFEKSLAKLLQSKPWNFGDMRIEPIPVDSDSLQRWHDYGTRKRASVHAVEPVALPAGRKTDQSLVGGEWLAFPAAGGGFSVGLFLPRPAERFRIFSDGLVLVFNRVWDRWPPLREAQELNIDDAAAIGQTSMICVRDGRWRVLGRDTPFDAKRWPLPTPWTPHDSDDSVVVLDTRTGPLSIPVDARIVNADPEAGECWSGSSGSWWGLETFAGDQATDHWKESMGVTPQRVAAWRHVNERIESRLGKHPLDLWMDEAD